MEIDLRLPARPRAWLWILQAIRTINAELIAGTPSFPLLYYSRVIYVRERAERFATADQVLALGEEDCDSLAAWRAGELEALGWLAVFPFEDAYPWATAYRPETIPARVVLTQEGPTAYHALVAYDIAGQTFFDDPSARLGMYGGLTPEIQELRP